MVSYILFKKSRSIKLMFLDYETTIQQAVEADHMLKEIEKMEAEIKELKDSEKNQEQVGYFEEKKQ